MSRRVWMRPCASLAVGVAVVGGLGGCARSGIKFTNVSDSWLNVWFYVAPTEGPGPCPNDMYRQRALQVEPGASANYRPPWSLVHIQVVEVSPTWVPTGREYWLELLTNPPIHIVANGRGEKLEFKSFRGEVAIIPESEWADGRFEHRINGEHPPVDADPEEAAAVTETPE
ncbi:MAG: hypothetical protein ACYTE6_06215 [Planctomycetota bacterium]